MSNSSANRSRAYEDRHRCACGLAFTLVELLVVIVVIGVVMSLLLLVGGRVLEHQKRATTLNTMRLTEMAIDQFKTTDPLRDLYNNPKLRYQSGGTSQIVGRTFGPYPPYQLYNPVDNTVGGALEPFYYSDAQDFEQGLGVRLSRDLSGETPTPAEPNRWVDIEQGNRNDDIRALYCYLAAFTPGVLDQVPDSAKKRLPERTDTELPELINPTGAGTNPVANQYPGAIDVLGIYDAWGVPLDYFLQVKLEYKTSPDGTRQQWVVTDRVPVLRSRGISAEKAKATDAAAGEDETLVEEEAENWIFSQTFPQPAAKCVTDARLGTIPTSGAATAANDGGWVRVRAGGHPSDPKARDSYEYVP